MILVYALGGGLGHLVRARAFLHTLGLESDAAVITASHHAADSRVLGDIEAIAIPRKLERDPAACRAWIAALLDTRRPEIFCVDAFPCGIIGELAGDALPHAGEAWHLARLLRWDEYAPLATGEPARFATTYRLEPLHDAHEAWIRRASREVCDLELRDPAVTGEAPDGLPPRFWLVVHSGPPSEVEELASFAEDLRCAERSSSTIVVATSEAPESLPAGAVVVSPFPASALFARAERIVSAAGFNVMRQTLPFRDRHVIVPLPRRFDDQFERARRARRG
ncbi:MAG: hypothetical protein ACSLFQ_07490 [Thermoanaerobaculia bacterium]